MKNALILHGAGNNSQGNWFPWLKSKLEKRGYKVWSPDLPNSDEPRTEDWLNAIFSNKEWQFNEDSAIIGHSAGATLVLRILERLPEGVRINKAILVAGVVELGTLPEFFQYKRGLVEKPFAWEKIKKSAKEFYFIHSEYDPYQCGTDQGKIMQKHLGGKLIIKPDEGHFNLEMGEKYRRFPFILEILEERKGGNFNLSG
ncbi:alpha/beta fold hydrolase [Candidatus Shapirobacteria bacterium]|nr:alpha/beta fold hydrolase [Candidatus Shapirobacteria bacterium]